MEILSWEHWKNDLQEFVDHFTSSNGLTVQTVLDISQKRATSSRHDMSLMFVPSTGSPQISEEDLCRLCELLPKVSRDWRYQIESAEYEYRRVLLTLSRPGVCIGAIQTITMMSSEERRQEPVIVHLDLPPGADGSLTAERQLLTRDVITRLLRWAGHDVTETGGDVDCSAAAAAAVTATAAAAVVCVTGNACPKRPPARENGGGGDADGDGGESRREEEDRTVRLVVEPVVNMMTGKKELDMTATELRRRRCASLLSAGRCRERGCSPRRAARLAAASVAHQMLSVSASSRCRVDAGPAVDPVDPADPALARDPGSGDTAANPAEGDPAPAADPAARDPTPASDHALGDVSPAAGDAAPAAADGAVFALYNGARLRALLARFEAEVVAGVYPPLPSVAHLGHHFSRLNTEDEWELVWHHLLPAPALIHSCAERALTGQPAAHRLCGALTALSRSFSRYYSRTHVLTPPLEHLTDTLHVRIHLLQAVLTVFDTYFHLLGYEPLDRM